MTVSWFAVTWRSPRRLGTFYSMRRSWSLYRARFIPEVLRVFRANEDTPELCRCGDLACGARTSGGAYSEFDNELRKIPGNSNAGMIVKFGRTLDEQGYRALRARAPTSTEQSQFRRKCGIKCRKINSDTGLKEINSFAGNAVHQAVFLRDTA